MSHRTDERARGEPSRRLELSRARRREAKPNHGNHRKLLAARAGDVDSEEDPLGYCFLRAIGGIAFTMQRNKNYNTLGINSLYLF